MSDNDRCRRCGWPWAIQPDGLCKNCQELERNPDNLSKRKKLGNADFYDMQKMNEEDRFKRIAKFITDNPGKDIAVMVDCGEGYSDKGDRYIRGVRALVPNVKVVGRKPGPAPEVETITLKIP